MLFGEEIQQGYINTPIGTIQTSGCSYSIPTPLGPIWIKRKNCDETKMIPKETTSEDISSTIINTAIIGICGFFAYKLLMKKKVEDAGNRAF